MLQLRLSCEGSNTDLPPESKPAMNIKLITSTALLAAAFLSPVQAQTIEWQPIFGYSFEPSDLTPFDSPDWVGYTIAFEIESTYVSSAPYAALRLEAYDDKNFIGQSHGLDFFPTGGTSSYSIPPELVDQFHLGWADGIGSLQIYATGGTFTLNKLSFSISAPSVGYFKDVQLSAVPEPRAFASLMVGLLSVGLVVYRRQQK